VSYENIAAAQEKISSIVSPTPSIRSNHLSQLTGKNIYLKLENQNISGSFKIRGAANALLSTSKKSLQDGILAASAGNHAQGVAIVAGKIKVPATIFMPKRTPIIKVEATKSLGAEVVLEGEVFDDAFKAAKAHQELHGGIFIHPYADPMVINGQGTIGLELAEQIKDLGTVIIPIGGGGLISGIACVLKHINPDIQVIGVQASAFPAMKMSFESGKHIKQQPIVTIADGIAVKTVHEFNLSLIRKYVDRIVTVEESEIAAAIMLLMERSHLLAEGAGAVSIAALLNIHTELNTDKPISCLISGSNIDVNLLYRIMMKGLLSSGRLSRLRFTLADTPGAMASLLKVISKTGANINEIHHDRTFASAHYSDVQVDAVLETSSVAHRDRLCQTLRDQGISFIVIN